MKNILHTIIWSNSIFCHFRSKSLNLILDAKHKWLCGILCFLFMHSELIKAALLLRLEAVTYKTHFNFGKHAKWDLLSMNFKQQFSIFAKTCDYKIYA